MDFLENGMSGLRVKRPESDELDVEDVWIYENAKVL